MRKFGSLIKNVKWYEHWNKSLVTNNSIINLKFSSKDQK